MTLAHTGPRVDTDPRWAVALWLCTCCTILVANGDDCECLHDEDHPNGDALDGYHVTLGMLSGEHDCGDPAHCRDRMAYYGEGCERIDFSSRQCGGCDSYLAGERHAATAWPIRY